MQKHEQHYKEGQLINRTVKKYLKNMNLKEDLTLRLQPPSFRGREQAIHFA